MANATIRALNIIKAMQSSTFAGISVSELAKRLCIPPANVCRDLDDLMEAGFVEKREDGRYQLSIALLQIEISYQTEYNRMTRRIAEINDRVYRNN